MNPAELPLRDLHLPDAVGWWPLAPGWWVLIGVAVLLMAWQAHRAWRRWRHNRSLRHARRELEMLEADYLQHRDPVRLARGVSALLRRTMLAYAPRDEVAGLTGDAWLQRLDRGLSVPYFHTDGGRSLLRLPYLDPEKAAADADVNALLAAAHTRLATPLGEPG